MRSLRASIVRGNVVRGSVGQPFLASSLSKNFNRQPDKPNLDKTLLFGYYNRTGCTIYEFKNL
jgi:hypothetical protein